MSSDHLEQPGENAGEQGGPHPPGPPNHRHEPPNALRWRLVFAMILGAILILLALIALAMYSTNRDAKAKASEQTLGDFAAQVKAACASSPVEARKVFGDACGTAKAIDARPAGQKGDTGAQGPTGPQGVQGPPPSAAQVASAVASYCTGGRCAGKGPSTAQVAVAVSAYCNARGQCQGPSGVPGSQGSPGRDGSDGQQGPTGAQGPGPTVEQVASAVSAYCGQDTKPCEGPAGQQGPPGPQGRGLVSVDCVDENGTSNWLITYDRADSDGKTTQTVNGPCRVASSSTGLVR